MPRPRKCRKVCHLPELKFYGPLCMEKDNKAIIMTVEEYEAIR